MSDARARLELAYRRTRYEVLLPSGWLALAIGPIDAGTEARLLTEAGCRQRRAFVTACNPWSEPLDDARNQQLHGALHAELRRAGQRFLPARHRDPVAAWPDEMSCFLIDPADGLAETLGRAFHQHAVVTGAAGAPLQLVWL